MAIDVDFGEEQLKQAAWPILMFHVMSKPCGAACNFACEYCFYRHNQRKQEGECGVVADDLLEEFIRQNMQAQVNPTVFFSWQGGEPTLAGIDFYRKVLEIQKRHKRPDIAIHNCITTNAYLLDAEWAAFLKENRFAVGVSLDGPADVHNANRRTAAGADTYARVREGIECLKAADVQFNAMTTITPANVGRAAEVYRFLTEEIGSSHLQFQPCAERRDFREVAPGHWDPKTCPKVGSREAHPGHPGSIMTDWSISAQQWGKFLCDYFDAWWSHGRETIRVSWFDSWASQFAGQPAHMCVTSGLCGRAVAMERDGKIYSCDHFVYPEYLLGDMNVTPLADIVRTARQREFGEAKQTKLPAFCKRCPFLFACYGECPKRRFLRAPDGQIGLNYLCAGFRVFFDHAGSRLAQHGQRFRPRPMSPL